MYLYFFVFFKLTLHNIFKINKFILKIYINMLENINHLITERNNILMSKFSIVNNG